MNFKKITLKTTIVFAFLLANVSYSNAQEVTVPVVQDIPKTGIIPANKSFLHGIWELNPAKVNLLGGEQMVLVHQVKIFNEDGTFQNLVFSPVEARISHKGKFIILDDNSYQEIIESQSTPTVGKLSGETYKIRYSFSKDKNQLFLKGTVKSNDGQGKFMFNETWNRVK